MKNYLMCMVCMCIMGAGALAVPVGPYPADPNTLHLWHFDTASSAIVSDMIAADPLDLPLVNKATLTASTAEFGNALNTYDGITGVAPYAGDAVNAVAMSRLTGSDGAFTFEAIVRPDMAPGAEPSHMEIICGESDGANDVRGFQFRIQDGGTTLRFQSLAGSIIAFDAPITYSAGQWYHAAVTYNGNANTAGNLKLFWTELGTATAAQQVGGNTFNLTADLTGTVMTKFAVGNELRGSGGIGTENFEGLIDEVRISSTARAAGDMMLRSAVPWARNPIPANGQAALNPATTTQVAWDTAEIENVTKHYLYLVENEPNFVGVSPTIVTDLSDPIESAVTLALDKMYYWRVDESIQDSTANDPNTVTGPVWFFETIKSSPVITADPAETAAFPTETASFEAGFNSFTSPTVSWYKAGDTAVLLASRTGAGITISGDITVVITDLGDGSFTSTLSIGNVEIPDEAEYYCSVTNGSAETETTLSAGLTVKRLLAYYPFDGNANDAVGTVHGTLKNIDPNNEESLPVFISGVPTLGSAVEFDGTQYVDLSTDAYPKSGLGGGLEAGTILCWVRIDTFTTAASMVLGTHNDGSGPACQMWYGGTDGQQINFRLRQNTGDTGMPYVNGLADTTFVGDGQWHLIAASYEKGSVGRLYVDGEPLGASAAYTASPAFNAWAYPMIIGANNNRGIVTDFLDGAVDDLQIYNYVLETNDIAKIYFEVTGQRPCINDYPAEYDYDKNCVIDLGDFAVFASQWMLNGFYQE